MRCYCYTEDAMQPTGWTESGFTAYI